MLPQHWKRRRYVSKTLQKSILDIQDSKKLSESVWQSIKKAAKVAGSVSDTKKLNRTPK